MPFEYIPASSELKDMPECSQVIDSIKSQIKDQDAVLYFQYPLPGPSFNYLPSIVVLDKQRGVLVIEVLPHHENDVNIEDTEHWSVDGVGDIDNPFFQLEDYCEGLKGKFSSHRPIRNKVNVEGELILPLFESLNPDLNPNLSMLGFWTGPFRGESYSSLWKSPKPLDDEQWNFLRSVCQGAIALSPGKSNSALKPSDVMGTAILNLNSQIALLDEDQHQAAIQIPDGPQRIRGLAGTGKTVILAMKAAYYHKRFPQKKILFTFHTQSLYTQAQNLISRFYKQYDNQEPNWDNLHVRHAWGGKYKPGVYSITCEMLNEPFFDWSGAKQKYSNTQSIFGSAISTLLEKANHIHPYYDFVLIDEAQDLPVEFFRLIYSLTRNPKQIVWAYDELQSLDARPMPNEQELFGGSNGNAFVNFTDGFYNDSIPMDIVLKKSYRNPSKILMLAHGFGLGLYRPLGPVQIIENQDTWESIGYNLVSGELVFGSDIVLHRPDENSPNPLTRCYAGDVPNISVKQFKDRADELDAICLEVNTLIREQNVPPEEIMIILLRREKIQEWGARLQSKLFQMGIITNIPGINESTDKFKVVNQVTISTIYKAKGNEASVVFVAAFDYSLDYSREIEVRNQAFTAITRSKGWCYISGIGEPMHRAQLELSHIQQNHPNFIFRFPDPNQIRRLSEEFTGRRAFQQKRVSNILSEFKKYTPEVFASELNKLSDEERSKIFQMFKNLGEPND